MGDSLFLEDYFWLVSLSPKTTCWRTAPLSSYTTLKLLGYLLGLGLRNNLRHPGIEIHFGIRLEFNIAYGNLEKKNHLTPEASGFLTWQSMALPPWQPRSSAGIHLTRCTENPGHGTRRRLLLHGIMKIILKKVPSLALLVQHSRRS